MEWYYILLIVLASLLVLFLIISFVIGGVLWDQAIPTKNPQALRKESNEPLEKEMNIFTEKTEKRLLDLHMEEITIRSFDGLKLHGYYREAPSKTNKTIISVHGRPGTALRTPAQFSEWLTEYNYNLLFIDLRSYGKSEGKYTTFGVYDHKDLLSWADYLIERAGGDIEICFYGLSMGGNTVLSTADKVPKEVKCIIEDCGFTSAYDQFAWMMKTMYHLPNFFISFASLINKVKLGWGFKDITTLNTVKNSKVPICFIHGDKDTFVPTYMSIKNHEVCTAPKELHIFKDAKHARSYQIHKDEYVKTCLDFLTKYF